MESIYSTTPKSSKSFFTPLLISMLGIASTSLAIILYHLIVIKYFTRRQQQQQQQQQTTATPPHPLPGCPQAAGVDPKVLDTIPSLAYSAQNRDPSLADDHESECAVCLGELEEGEMVRLLPNCGHPFHVTCIDRWFAGHASCPLCRAPVVAGASPCVDNEDDDRNEVRPPSRDRENGIVGGDEGVNGSAISTSHSCGLLRHCASMVLPVERTPVTDLKRSLSMDQSFLVINIQRESERACSSSSSSDEVDDDTTRRTYVDRSMMQLDRVSSKLLGSFSRLRVGGGGGGGGGGANNPNLLPY